MSFNITATFTVVQGRADEAEKLIKAIKADVDANEPGTLKYITTRGLDNDHQFVIFEEYENVAAQEKHREGKAYQAFRKHAADTNLLEGGLNLIKSKQV